MKKISSIILLLIAMAYCFGQGAGFRTILPAQAGHAGEFLTTNGIGLSWASVSGSITIPNGRIPFGSISNGMTTDSAFRWANIGKVLFVNGTINTMALELQEPTGGQTIELNAPTISANHLYELPSAVETGILTNTITGGNTGQWSWTATPNGRLIFGSASNLPTTDSAARFTKTGPGGNTPNLHVFNNSSGQGNVYTNTLFLTNADGTVTNIYTQTGGGAYAFGLPASAGTDGFVLKTDGGGNTDWVDAATLITGGNGEVTFFNNSGDLSSSAQFLFNTATNHFQVGDIGVTDIDVNPGTGTIALNGGQIARTRVVTAAGDVTVDATDYVVIVNKASGAATAVNLPAGVTGTVFVIKDGKGDANANNITVTPAAGNIDGSGTFVMNVNYQSVSLVYNGTQWNKF